MTTLSYTLISSLLAILLSYVSSTHARALVTNNPRVNAAVLLQPRQYPTFPADPPSCPKCAQGYSNINSCAAAAPVLANVSMIIFNPGAFVDVIKCACTDTFQSVYPQCVDCFTRTNQTDFLSAPADSLPGIISGIRNICALESTLLGNVSATNGEISSSVTDGAAVPTDSSVLASSADRRFTDRSGPGYMSLMALTGMTLAGALGLMLSLH